MNVNLVLICLILLSTSALSRQVQTIEEWGPADSLAVTRAMIDIEEADIEIGRTDLFHRLIPEVTASASVGFRDLFMYDPASTVASIVPSDALRVNLSLSISGLFDNSHHRLAELKRERIEVELANLKVRIRTSREETRREIAELDSTASLLMNELALREDILAFDSLRFNQGEIKYDLLVRSQLDILSSKAGLIRLNRTIKDLKARLRND